MKPLARSFRAGGLSFSFNHETKELCLPVSHLAQFQLLQEAVSCLSSWWPLCAYFLQMLAALMMLSKDLESDGLMKWWDGSRGPRCYVRKGNESVWVVTAGCGGCQSSGLWATALIMTSQDGTTFDSRSVSTLSLFLAPPCTWQNSC